MKLQSHLRRRRVFIGAAAFLLVGALTACSNGQGGDTGNGDKGAVDSDVVAAVAEAMKPIDAWPGPDATVTPVSGKKVTIITCGSTGITCVRVANGAKAASEALGWDATIIDGKNQPAVWNSAISQAIASGTDAIVLAAVPPITVQEAVKEAKAKGIPLAYVLGLPDDNVITTIDMPREKAAEYMAAWLAEDSGGKAKVFQLNVKEFPEAVVYNDALAKKLKEVCSGCEVVGKADFSMALANQRIPGLVTSALQTNPEINYVSAPFDAVSLFINQGIQQSGKKGIKVVGLGADPEGIKGMQDGSMAASVAMPAEWMGWQAVDAFVRHFADIKVETPEVPIRLITQKNVQKGDGGWGGDLDYQSEYKKLWGK